MHEAALFLMFETTIQLIKQCGTSRSMKWNRDIRNRPIIIYPIDF